MENSEILSLVIFTFFIIAFLSLINKAGDFQKENRKKERGIYRKLYKKILFFDFERSVLYSIEYEELYSDYKKVFSGEFSPNTPLSEVKVKVCQVDEVHKTIYLCLSEYEYKVQVLEVFDDNRARGCNSMMRGDFYFENNLENVKSGSMVNVFLEYSNDGVFTAKAVALVK